MDLNVINLWETYEKSLGNLWETYGKPMGHLWLTMGNLWLILKRLVESMENPVIIWMITGGSYILGNLHMEDD